MKTGKRESDCLFLGLDSSTQGLKACVVDHNLKVVYEGAVNFDAELPEFKTEGGVHRHPDGLTVTSPAIMWVAALDRLLQKMKDAKCPIGRISALSGSGQQHGSVWMKKAARRALRQLDARRALREQMEGVFSVADSPIWMDSSTSRQCAERERALGGPQAVADLTGSRAYERFTGNQIARIFQERPAAYEATDRIALVSSFVASLLVGDYVPIDASDGSGMNLMDLRRKAWDRVALDCTAPGLGARLGPIVLSHAVIGKIHGRYVEGLGFDANCLAVAFSGDNPCSLAGLRLQRAGDIAISLGTSDTVFGSLAEPRPSATEGHIFANPVDPAAYMAMVCYKNGSLTRESVRDQSAGGAWDTFNGLLDTTPAGNEGRIGFYIKEPEITPPILKTGTFRFNGAGEKVDSFPPEADVRAVLEGQFLSMRLHGAHIGLKPSSILATGGASANRSIIGVMANVFGVPVYVGEQPNSAASGAAYRALHGWKCADHGSFVPFDKALSATAPFKRAAEPDKKAHAVYSAMLERYAGLEKQVIGRQ